jgi:hypothetical protein
LNSFGSVVARRKSADLPSVARRKSAPGLVAPPHPAGQMPEGIDSSVVHAPFISLNVD